MCQAGVREIPYCSRLSVLKRPARCLVAQHPPPLSLCSQDGNRAYFALSLRDSQPDIPMGFLADVINMFGTYGGFDAILARVQDPDTPIGIKLALAHSFNGAMDVLTRQCIEVVSRVGLFVAAGEEKKEGVQNAGLGKKRRRTERQGQKVDRQQKDDNTEWQTQGKENENEANIR